MMTFTSKHGRQVLVPTPLRTTPQITRKIPKIVEMYQSKNPKTTTQPPSNFQCGGEPSGTDH